MAEKRDYYEVLGISKDADEATIKKAYRTMAKKYHPDLNPGDKVAEEKFKEVNEANEILSDPDKRAKYDRFGHAAFDPAAGGGGGFGGGFSGFGGGGFDFDLGDILGSMFGMGGGGRRRDPNAPERGRDIEARLVISFEEAAFGTKKDITYTREVKCAACGGYGTEDGSRPEVCPDCHGSGQRIVMQRMGGMAYQSAVTCEKCRGRGKIVKKVCSKCRGDGLLRESTKTTVNIPAGVNTGNHVVQRGMGYAGKNGGPAGDLIVTIVVRDHAVFQREGYDIYCTVTATVAEATLGAEITIPTLEGDMSYTIPEGTQPGTMFTVRGRGIPMPRTQNRRGDLNFTVNVEIPKRLNERQKEAMRAFAESCGEERFAQKGELFKRKKGKK